MLLTVCCCRVVNETSEHAEPINDGEKPAGSWAPVIFGGPRHTPSASYRHFSASCSTQSSSAVTALPPAPSLSWGCQSHRQVVYRPHPKTNKQKLSWLSGRLNLELAKRSPLNPCNGQRCARFISEPGKMLWRLLSTAGEVASATRKPPQSKELQQKGNHVFQAAGLKAHHSHLAFGTTG